MSTPVRRGRTLRSRLLAFITDATSRLTSAWRILTQAQTRLLDALARIRPGRGGTTAQRAATLAFRRSLADFDRDVAAFAERWAATDLPLIYREGALTTLDHLDRPHRLWGWTRSHRATITTLTAQYYADLMGRLQEALRRARAFLRDALDAVRARFGRFEHGTLDRQALLRNHPLNTVIYANDARHPVEAWAKAAISWQAVTTANTAAARTALEELDCQWLEVRDGAGCGWTSHEDPDAANGTLRTVQDALAHPSAHPHCQRELLPRPDVITPPNFALGGFA
ncbi:hypothetical protein ACFQ6Q_00445 [Streptomyces sp. NPDC056437]|uniref:hypothetical protein n=1 Tax=Streptomyces sp. NPDC056437 TaxID=3345816 RepID=UPI0036AA2E71